MTIKLSPQFSAVLHAKRQGFKKSDDEDEYKILDDNGKPLAPAQPPAQPPADVDSEDAPSPRRSIMDRMKEMQSRPNEIDWDNPAFTEHAFYTYRDMLAEQNLLWGDDDWNMSPGIDYDTLVDKMSIQKELQGLHARAMFNSMDEDSKKRFIAHPQWGRMLNAGMNVYYRVPGYNIHKALYPNFDEKYKQDLIRRGIL